MNLLTPPGAAGIAVLRAGAEERALLRTLLHGPNAAPPRLEPGSPPSRAELRIGGVAVDDVLVIDRGAAGLEIHVHGAPAIVDALRTVFDVRVAAPDSAAERLLWHAMSHGQLALAHEQMAVDFDAFLRGVAVAPLPRQRQQIHAAVRRSRIALAHTEPQRLVLVGAQNAGKSSLLNTLLLRERVLAGPQPGLTRDPVAEIAVLDEYPYEIVDTAGEGPTSSAADAQALAMAREARTGAMTVLVVDRAIGPTATDRRLAADAMVVIANKTDLPPGPWPADLPRDLDVSCRTDEPGRIRRELGRLLRERRGLPPAGPVAGPAALTRADAVRLEEFAARLPR